MSTCPEKEPDPVSCDCCTTARRYLRQIERADHPAAEDDPVGALGQVAADLMTAVKGYRALGVVRCE